MMFVVNAYFLSKMPVLSWFISKGFSLVVIRHQSTWGAKLNTKIGNFMGKEFWINWVADANEALFNRHKPKDVTKYGPDLACAYWLLRVGASFQLVDDSQVISSKWTLRKIRKSVPDNKIRLEYIDFSDSVAMSRAFEYLRNLNHVKSVKLNFCNYIRDEAVLKLALLEHTLEDLEIQVCGDVTDGAIIGLQSLKKLKTLKLYLLPKVQDRTGVIKYLRRKLPHCKIVYPEFSGRIGTGAMKY